MGSDDKGEHHLEAENDAQRSRSLPFDGFERYSLTQRILGLLLGGDGVAEPVSVLDVGGASSSLKLFLPQAWVVLADPMEPPAFSYRPDIPFRHDGYVQALGGQLPFADTTFDVVTAHDTIEHVPPEAREAFVKDLLRVSRRFVIFNGPVQGPDTGWAEQRLAVFWQRALSWERHPALAEHLELGLPAAGDIHRLIEAAGCAYVGIPNGNLTIWLAAMTLKHYASAFPDGEAVHEQMDRLLNDAVAPDDFLPPCYREAQVVAKEPADAALLDAVAKAFRLTRARQSAARAVPAVTVLEPLLASLEQHAAGGQARVQGLNERVAELIAMVQARDRSIMDRDDTIRERDAALADQAVWLAERDEELARQRAEVEQRDRAVAERDAALAGLHGHVQALEDSIRGEHASLGYRALAKARTTVHRIAPHGTNRRGALLIARSTAAGARGGARGMRERLRSAWVWPPRLVELSEPTAEPPSVDDVEEVPFGTQYRMWRAARPLTAERVRAMASEASSLVYRPLVSVVMPVYNSDPRTLSEAIESLRSQIYRRWELCVADDCSPAGEVRTVLARYARKDRRVKVRYLTMNRGIAGASNEALGMAGGEFVAFLDHDDVLTPDALFEVVKLLNADRSLDFIYTDEDKLDVDGSHVDPFFKPDWSPDLLLSMNYVTHFSVYRKRLLDDIGGFRNGVDGSQDYDLVLRATARTDRVGHIAKPLYSWRKAPGSAATSIDAKPYAYPAARKAIGDYLASKGISAEVDDTANLGSYVVRYAIEGSPRVAVVIPTRDRLPLLKRCIDSVRDRSTYTNYEIVVVDHQSRERATRDYLAALDGHVLRYDGEFNFSRMVNLGARAVDSDMVLLLNNDVEVIAPDWMEAMIEHAQRPEVAAVGARLLLADGSPQHEGILIGSGGGLARNLDHSCYIRLGDVIRNCSAVSAACMLTRRSVFDELGGFDEDLAVDYNDVDFCLRAREKGYRIIYTPCAVLSHDEGSSRGRGVPRPADVEAFRRRWSAREPYRDPYYNPNLDLDHPFCMRLP